MTAELAAATAVCADSLERLHECGTIANTVLGLRHRWIILVAILVTMVTIRPGTARAEAEVIPPPGWAVSSAAAPDAQRRASAWKQALDLPITQVMSSPFDDRFRETIAVFALPEPLSARSFNDEAQAQARLQAAMAGIVGDETPVASAMRVAASGSRVAWSRWTVDKLSYDGVLAPSGEDATLVVMVVRASTLADHSDLLDGVVSELAGVTAPLPDFSLLGWRIGSILVWIALSLVLHFVWLRFADHEGDHAHAGRRAALVTFAVVLVGAIVAHVLLGGRALAIEHAGSSRNGLTMWIAAAGICVAGLHFMLAARLDRGVVQSAPSSGVFASSSFSGSFIHASLSQSSMRVQDLAASSHTSLPVTTPASEPPAPRTATPQPTAASPRQATPGTHRAPGVPFPQTPSGPLIDTGELPLSDGPQWRDNDGS